MYVQQGQIDNNEMKENEAPMVVSSIDVLVLRMYLINNEKNYIKSRATMDNT
jgi:hypothetical protein